MFGLTACDMYQNTKTSIRLMLLVQYQSLYRACIRETYASDTKLIQNNERFTADSKRTRIWTNQLYNEFLSF